MPGDLLQSAPWTAHYPAGVPGHLDYPAEPVFWLLEETARRAPDRVACRYYRQQVTYAELLDRARRMAAALKANGLRPGGRVGVLLPNVPEYLVALFGTWMAGGVCVPLSPLMVAEEIAALLRSTDCRHVVALDVLLPLIGSDELTRPDVTFVTTLRDRLPLLDRMLYRVARISRLTLHSRYRAKTELPLDDALAAAEPLTDGERPTPDCTANILPTGGTTGRPKAVVLTHRNLLANALQVNAWTKRPFGTDVVLACLPFFHSYGLMTCGLCSLAMGGTVVMHHRFRAEPVLRLIERTRPTLVPAVPAMLAAFNRVLAKRRFDLSSIQAVISGGAPLPPAVAAEFSGRSGAVVVEGYGLSEASPVTHAGPLDGTARPGTMGLPLPDTDALVVDADGGTEPLGPGQVGELVVRGPQVMAGYWNDPDGTAAALKDGWLHTGDLAVMDADGFFKIVDRKKDLIITSGVNVYPTDVEHVLRAFDGLDDVAVLGVPDPQRGEVVKAVVVMEDGVKFHRRAFDDFARHHLEVHRRPRLVEVVRGPLPRNPLGKVLRRVLREQHAAGEVTRAESESVAPEAQA
ncbi:MAG: long-chain fatty acid--CoA ligase [Gemmataceae bacterium]|nr:long-chain fatty acid--CoA ligase [Gemmataceae bacterium]